MVAAKQIGMISKEEARIMLLEQRNDDFYQALIRIEGRFEQVDKRFEQVDKRFEQVDKRFEQVDKRFEQLMEHMDKRFEQENKRFEQFEARFNFLETRIDSNFKWILAFIMPSFVGILGLMAHGFKWF